MLDRAGRNFKIADMTLIEFNSLSKKDAGKELFSCCGSSGWQEKMMKEFPFSDEMVLLKHAQDIWYSQCNETDWLEAFTHHPKIGDVAGLTDKHASTQHLAVEEQSGVRVASTDSVQELARANMEYEARFGFIFIICATGKSADEMLRLLRDRLKNSLREELHIAMGEQCKITVLRLQKLLDKAQWNLPISQVTTHVLDTSIGMPGNDITIRLKQFRDGLWETFAQGVTNKDGRIADLLPPVKLIHPDNYKMVFETGNYFMSKEIKGFYPEVAIQFTILDEMHYHIPLLINPFGYSTYRGS
jgi:hydroxyisourate hydrolase